MDDAPEPAPVPPGSGAVEDTSEDPVAQEALAALAALRASESRFRSLVQHAGDAIVIVDALGNLVFATPSAERLTGAAVDSALGTSVLDWVHEDDRAVVAQSFLNTASTPGTAVPLQMRMRRADGEVRYVEVVASNLLDDPAVSGIVMNVRDLTDTKESASALEMTETRFRHLVENISDTVMLVDREGQILLSTGNLRTILGFPTTFWGDSDRNIFELLYPDDTEAMRQQFSELLDAPGQQVSAEARVRNADDEWQTIEIHAVNLLEDESVQGVVLTMRNITARKRFEADLAEARDQAVRSLEMRTEFIASVSHELRTPIHGVLGLSELLATADLDDEARDLARSISRATESLRMVLDDILDFSKIEVGRLEVNVEPVRLQEVAQDVDALFGGQAAAKGIRLIISKSSDLPEWVMGDGLRVRQVLNNLVGNAIKFTFSGEVTATAKRVVDGQGAPIIRVEVSDTGIGIPFEEHDRVFEPFSQAHQSTRNYGGTGLGLSIARRLVELMGGELDFVSTPGRGSTFWFTVPLVELVGAANDDVDQAPTVEPVLARPARVMVVEDNPINQLLVLRQLERLGYEAEVFDTGQAALDAFPQSSYDVVLMDWQLPGIDGLETTRRLRAWEREHKRTLIPIVAMTASALPGDRGRCLDAGMDDFIAKPVSMATLGRVVQRWSIKARDNAPAVAFDSAGILSGVRGGGVDGPSNADSSSALDPSALDRSALDRLVEELADPLLVVTVARTYLRELPGRVTRIGDAIAADDRAALAAASHTLKSTSAAVGATGLSDLCLRLEQAARLSSTTALPVDGDEVQRASGDVARDLEVVVVQLEVAARAAAADVVGAAPATPTDGPLPLTL